MDGALPAVDMVARGVPLVHGAGAVLAQRCVESAVARGVRAMPIR